MTAGVICSCCHYDTYLSLPPPSVLGFAVELPQHKSCYYT